MSDTDQIQSEPDETKGHEEPAQSFPGLGATLKAERERRGLSIEQVASVTKLRRQMIDALENEAWADLPASVFVRGFIRTYAKLLGMDEKDLLSLYERVIPAKAEPLVPLAAPRKSRKGWYLVAVLAVVLLGIVYYLWQAYPLHSWEALFFERQASPEGETKTKVAAKKTQPKIPEGREGPASTPVGLLPAPGVPGVDPDIARLSRIEERLRDDREKRPPEVSEVQEKVLPVPVEREEAYVLKAVVVERTWIRISIDDGEPREYLFNPDDRLQWKAKEGFALLVGNAGGIELELNGQNLGKLGDLAQVIRLKLPKGYTPKRTED